MQYNNMINLKLAFDAILYACVIVSLVVWSRSRRSTKPEGRATDALSAIDTVGGWDDAVPKVDVLVDGEMVLGEDEDALVRDLEARGGKVVVIPPELSRRFHRFSAVVAREVKAKMGTPTLSAANWLVAHDLVQKVLAEKHVRKVDRAIFAPLACQMVFVPTKFDVYAAEFLRSNAVADRQNEFMGSKKRSWWERMWGLRKEWKPPMMMRG